jgi:hypothetical protein
MPALKFLLALASAAILALSSAPVPANALVADRAQVARHVRGHDAFAKRKRSDASSPSACIPRPSSTPPPTSTPAPASTPAPTSTTPTSSAPPASTSATNSNNNGKQWGLAWGADDSYLPNFALPGVGYLYTWGPYLPSSIPDGIVPIPMLWGYDQVTDFQTLVVAGYANTVLGMNEPNEPSQSNLTPQQGVDMWMQYIVPLKALGYYLISPACTDDDAGLTWYQQFFELCAGNCLVDAIAFHAYSTNASDLITYANTLHDTYNMDVWITEFADQVAAHLS